MDEEELIICVQDYPNLYDMGHCKYHDKNVKLNSWQEIGARLNQPAEQCKTKWTSLRDCYRKALLKRETRSGQSAKKMKPWRLEQQMEFVKTYVNVQRDQESNISDNEELDNTEVTEIPLVNISPSGAQEPASTSAVSAPGSDLIAPEAAPTAPEVAAPRGTVNEDVGPYTKRPKTCTWKKPKTLTPTAAVFQDYVNFRREQSRNIPTVVVTTDHLTKYFQGIEETVRTLPPELQIRVKSQISRIVHDAELQAISVSLNPCNSIEHANTAPNPFETNRNMMEQQLSAPILRMEEYQRPQERQFTVSPGGSSNYSYLSNSTDPNYSRSPDNVFVNTMLHNL